MNNEHKDDDTQIIIGVALITGALVSLFGYIFWKQLQQEKVDNAAMFGR